MTTTRPSLSFDQYVSFIDRQLKNNALLIEEADVVFVCGKNNTGLTTISLKVGEMKCVKKTNLNKKLTSLVIANNEYSTFDLVDLMKKVGLLNDRRTMHYFTESRYTATVDVLKNTQSVVVMENPTKTDRENILLEMAKNLLSGAIITHRFPVFNKELQRDLLHTLKITTRCYGLKLLFIETVKDPETGLIDLSFSPSETLKQTNLIYEKPCRRTKRCSS